MAFTAPVADISFALRHQTDFPALMGEGRFADLGADTLEAVLGEAGRFASDVVAPLNRTGDLEPARLQDGAVVTPPGFAEAYHAWCEGGWMGLAADPEAGGQGLPYAANAAVAEMINAASLSFSLSILLTQGAASALATHASAELGTRYLPKMISGEWTGTMNLTEPQSGSDLATIRTRAVPDGAGAYRITGQKIFITYGEQEWTANIIHLVLARLADAPAGTGGISLFLVPKRLVDADGEPGERNDLRALRLENKLGIHGSPTCVMSYGESGGAVGYLVGEENRGLAAMFTMMNLARLMVAIQGVGVAERATQQAIAYANQRLQGRGAGDPADVSVPIARHPDVHRMLTEMRAQTAAARAICLNAAVAFDLASHGAGEEARRAARARNELLTPIAKAYSTDIAVEVASTGIQVHGGTGYMEETGAAQHLRDARILPIYEGTNGIQAIDLVQRKVVRDGGEAAGALIAELRAIAADAMAANEPLLGPLGDRLDGALDDLAAATRWIVNAAPGDSAAVLAGATPYLRLFALAAGGGYLARGALAAARGDYDGPDRDERILLARVFAETALGATAGLSRTVTEAGTALGLYELPAAGR
jgi:alkylation response protein AidB-like acyl-CoA dehydrogenase